MPPETPLAFGLHPNAEIGFQLREAEAFCSSLVLLQPREAGGEGGMSTEEKAKMVLDDLVERLPDEVGSEGPLRVSIDRRGRNACFCRQGRGWAGREGRRWVCTLS